MATVAEPEQITIQPQEGPQVAALSSPADIVIYGGSAGGGKTWFLLVDPLRHIKNPRFGAVIFRRTTPQIRNQGAMWDASMQIYPHAKGSPRSHVLEWKFPSGAAIKFQHLEREESKLDLQGSEIPYIGFDELTHFTESQFWYMLSRNRTTCGIRPCVRATCNPDADSWVAGLISWWINQDTGYAIPERSGVIRWFVRVNEKLHWADTAEELREQFPDIPPKSLTFIHAKLDDNRVLQEADPNYYANLMALPLIERERLLSGNWKIRPIAGNIFRKEWFKVFPDYPRERHGSSLVRFWDKAGSSTNGDWSTGLLMMRRENIYWVIDVVRGRWSPLDRNKVMKQTCELDDKTWGKGTIKLHIEQEPGNGGKESAMVSAIELAEWGPQFTVPSQNKETRARPFSCQVQAGNVHVLNTHWTNDYINELCAFPSELVHDDQVDASSGAFNNLAPMKPRQPHRPIRSARPSYMPR